MSHERPLWRWVLDDHHLPRGLGVRTGNADLYVTAQHIEEADACQLHGIHGPIGVTGVILHDLKDAGAAEAVQRFGTVCDPAIGSGAFPVGMMTEIVRARIALTPYFNDVAERTAYHFKRHAIQNSLYGVDIDAGAVEIAKLRLWLSLVVDEEDVKQIKPLPNLDYKVVVGNSLMGVEKDLFNNELFTRLEELKPKFFDESYRDKKAEYKENIEDLIHQLTNGKETFDFEIYFSEVFHAKSGFDVVIANPPYVSVEKFARTALQADWKRNFKTYASRGDIYCLFFEQGLAPRRRNPHVHQLQQIPARRIRQELAPTSRIPADSYPN